MTADGTAPADGGVRAERRPSRPGRRARLLIVGVALGLAVGFLVARWLRHEERRHRRSSSSVRFQPPDEKHRIEAVGPIDALEEALRRAFNPLATDLRPLPAPRPGDWLDAHEEEGQTFEQFIGGERNVPGGRRRTLHLVPLGGFGKRAPLLERLREYAALFFGLETVLLPALDVDDLDITSRENPRTGGEQLLTEDILDLLEKRLPPDSFALSAVTLTDLFPEPTWNFVFGQASLRSRVGVYSFARYDAAFTGEPPDEQRFLRRSLGVLAHEIGHMFTMQHCIFFACLMNGSNHLEESDSQPLHLCPVCLRKLHSSVPFDVAARYKGLQRFYDGAGLEAEAGRTRRRWLAIGDGS